MANTTPVARVSAVEGQAFAKGKNGELRALHVGDLIYEGDVLVTVAGSHIDLAAPDGHTFVLRENETLTVDAEVMAAVPPDATDSAIQGGGSDIDTVVNAINEGGSLDALLEATAAGDVGAGADGGPTFVRLLRITEGVDPLGFEFGTARRVDADEDQNGAAGNLVQSATLTPFPEAPVTDIPTTDDKLVSGQEDGGPIAITLTGSDVDGTVASFTIDSLPTNGTLSYNGSPVTVGQVIAATSNAASLTFTPNANWNGDTSFQYAATDNDGNTDATPATVSITVGAVNDAPTSADGAVTGTEDVAYVFKWADFNISDVDGGPNSGLLITTLPATGDGVLERYDGTGWIAVAAGDTIAQAQIQNGGLRFVSANNESGIDAFGGSGVGNRQSDYVHFDYRPTDGSTDNGTGAASTMTVDIAPVADAPTLTISATAPIFTPEHIHLSIAGGGSGGGFDVVDRIVTEIGTSNRLWSLSDYVANGGNANGTDTVGDIFVVGDAAGDITQAWRTQVQSFHGGGTEQSHPNDYIYLAGNASDYEISYTEQHINGVFSGYDGVKIRDRSTNVSTQTSNNIEDIIFGDGSTMSGNTAVVRTVTPAYNTYALNLSAALTDLDGSEVLSNITLTGIPNGVALNHGTKQSDGSWVLTSAELSGLTMTVPVSISSGILIAAEVSAIETANGDRATTTATLSVNVVPLAVDDTNSMLEDAGTLTGNVLSNDRDTDGDALSVSSFSFGGVTYGAGTTATVAGLGSLVVRADGTYSYTPASHYSGSPAITYTASDGKSSSTASVNIAVIPVHDAPILIIDNSTVVGGSTDDNPLPVSTGLRLSHYAGLESVLSDAAAANTLNLESAMESRSPTTATIVSSVGVAESSFHTGDGYRYTGYIYMDAGHTYTFSGYRDDTIQMKLGGTTVLSSGFNTWTTYSESFTPLVSGYYSFELNVYNGDSIGELTAYVAVDGGAALALNTSNFDLYANSADLISSGTSLGSFVSNGDGGYYPVDIIGADNMWISLGSISATLVDDDGSETLTVWISGVPVGASLTDGSHSFVATSTQTGFNASGWNLSALQFRASSGYSGVVELTVTATATEIANGDSASSTGKLSITVADATAPTLYVPETLVVVSEDATSTYRTVSLPIVATLADSSETLSVLVAGLPDGAVLRDGSGHSFSASMSDSSVNISSWDLSSLTITIAQNYTSTGTAITVTATSTAYGMVNGVNTALDAASTSQDIVLVSDYTTTSASGNSGGNNLTGNDADNYLNGLGGNDTIDGRGGNDLLLGGTGNDTIYGGAGTDVIYGGDGNDTIGAGTGSDRLVGGTGNDTMYGNAANVADTTTDIFQWLAGDAGSVSAPAIDTIADFGIAPAANGGDILDLRDLLSGSASTPGELDNYLHFQVVGGTTTVFVSTTGAFGDNNTVNTTSTSLPSNVGNNDVQQIVLTGVDLVGGNTTDQQVIQALLNNGKLIVDS